MKYGVREMVFTALLGVAFWSVMSFARWALGLPDRRVVLESRERLALRVAGACSLVAGWAWLIWRGV